MGYRLEVVPEIQKFLQTGMIMDNKTLYKVSIKHLPREAKDVGSVNELLKKKKTESKSGLLISVKMPRLDLIFAGKRWRWYSVLPWDHDN